ncbi:MAG: TAT (twin-arginine translocation) pathway signal sequence [Pelosinus sp.]|nr:TAT (twin-arginine translocation) pathway signal sequence [Pelosinus sp.]
MRVKSLLHSIAARPLCIAATAALAVFSSQAFAAPVSLQDCQSMSAVSMAEHSKVIMDNYDFLLKTANELSSADLRSKVTDYLKNPVPSLMAQYQTDEQKEKLKSALNAAGYIKVGAKTEEFLPALADNKKAPQPFYAAPGSGYQSHHAYPGGLVTHVAVNTKVALGIYNAYKDVFGFKLDRDIIVASELMHDMNKPWVFQWQQDGASTPEFQIAGTGAHHILSIAEAMYRGFPKELIVAIACAHTAPSSPAEEQQVVDWLKAAAIIAGKDPLALGVLDSEGKTLPQPRWMEGFVTHLGDHDFVLTGPMNGWMTKELEKIAQSEYGMNEAELKTAKFYHFRDYVYSQLTTERLYSMWVSQGEAELIRTIQTVVTK